MFKSELSNRDQTIADLLTRNQELESENQRLRELLNRQGESKDRELNKIQNYGVCGLAV